MGINLCYIQDVGKQEARSRLARDFYKKLIPYTVLAIK